MEETVVAQRVPTTIAPAHIEVEVKPEAIPVQREADLRMPRPERTSAVIEEHAPSLPPAPSVEKVISKEEEKEEIRLQRAEAARSVAGAGEASRTAEKTTTETKAAGHGGAADVVTAIFDVLTGKK
jgi:hypothetical protein